MGARSRVSTLCYENTQRREMKKFDFDSISLPLQRKEGMWRYLTKNTTTVFILWFRNDVILHVTIGGQSTSFRNEFLDLVVSNFQPMRRLRISSLYIQNCSKPLKWKCFDIIHKSLFFVVTTQMYLTVVDLKGEMLQDLHFHVNRIFDLVLNPSYLLME